MNQTIKLDAKKREGSFCKERIYPLRRGERNNVTLTVAVRRDRRPYDLAGMTAHLVWQAADGKLVGPVPMEVTDPAAGTVRCTLPDACYAAVGMAHAYIEIRNGAELVDTTDEMSIEVLDCIDADAEQAEEYKPLIAEVREATDAAIKAAAKAVSDTQAAIADVKATEAKLYPVAENILVGSETGAVAHVEDAFAGAALRKITVEGACKQDGIPSPDAPKPIAVVENPVVKVVGRNVLDIAALAKESPEYYKADGDTLTILKTDNRAWTTFAATQELKAGTYILSGDFVELKDIDGNSLSFSIGTTGAPFTLPVDTKVKVKVGYGRASESYPYTTKAMIELSSSASDYAPYSPQSRAFTLPAEHPYLAKLPDGTADEIVVDEEGNVELVARVSKAIPKDSDRLDFGAGTDTNVPYVSFPVSGIANMMGILSNSYQTSYWINKSGYIYCPNGLDIAIRDSRFTSKEKAIELLNGVVVYIAVEPTRYSLGKIEMPKAQDSIVNAWTDAEVTPNTGIWYVRDVNIVVANLESAIASITEG